MTLHISELGGQIYCPPSSRAHCFVSWADNRFVQVSFSGNPQNICDKPIVSDIQSHENNVCDRFVSREQNSSQLEWETMTFSARAAKRRGLKISHCFSRKLRWILFEREKTVANVILMTFHIRNYRFIANVWGFLLSDKSIVSPAHSDKSIVSPAHKAWARELGGQ